jgi:hypothetical protein
MPWNGDPPVTLHGPEFRSPLDSNDAFDLTSNDASDALAPMVHVSRRRCPGLSIDQFGAICSFDFLGAVRHDCEGTVCLGRGLAEFVAAGAARSTRESQSAFTGDSWVGHCRVSHC